MQRMKQCLVGRLRYPTPWDHLQSPTTPTRKGYRGRMTRYRKLSTRWFQCRRFRHPYCCSCCRVIELRKSAQRCVVGTLNNPRKGFQACEPSPPGVVYISGKGRQREHTYSQYRKQLNPQFRSICPLALHFRVLTVVRALVLPKLGQPYRRRQGVEIRRRVRQHHVKRLRSRPKPTPARAMSDASKAMSDASCVETAADSHILQRAPSWSVRSTCASNTIKPTTFLPLQSHTNTTNHHHCHSTVTNLLLHLTCVFGGGGTRSRGGGFGLAATRALCAALAFSCSSEIPSPATRLALALNQPVRNVLRRRRPPKAAAPVTPPFPMHPPPPPPLDPLPLAAAMALPLPPRGFRPGPCWCWRWVAWHVVEGLLLLSRRPVPLDRC